ncbi:VOC family protein [Pelagibacterium lentulum]|uniref:Dioxygenase n=1 Tax=Pelagibacterium lentulum TaxID=2029865 RepID=A0A916RIR1_9HYPH|nr:VOC family protein [Pelagibacterium lentulum]GGA58817.1 dioxygenase [Pelagibacterium lentulum]
MLNQIKGLHHVTAMAGDADANNRFFTGTLGLRRVKKTVNFDEPSVYHLYYGDEEGTPGSVMTYFPFPHIIRGRPGSGEVGETVFSVPEGSLGFWKERLASKSVQATPDESFGQKRLRFSGPDGDALVLVETGNDTRAPWTGGSVKDDEAIRGFFGASMRVRDSGATEELLKFMGYEPVDTSKGIKRFAIPGGNGADYIDVQTLPNMPRGDLGAGSVHHIAFAVENRAAQLEVRNALIDTGYQVTPVIDRDYFWAIYFRTPGGVLFEIATNEPGFARDEDPAHLGEALKLPTQHEHLRSYLETSLPQIKD